MQNFATLAFSGDRECRAIFGVKLYRKVRLARHKRMSERAAVLHFGISRSNVKKMTHFSVPPGYQRTAEIKRPKLDGFTSFVDKWFQEDLRVLSRLRWKFEGGVISG